MTEIKSKSEIYSKAVQLLGFCVFITAFFNYYADRTGIEYTQFIKDNISMYKDLNGVPNIQAESIEDAYFALGFAHAEDRLWAMYFSHKVALGEVSELFGEKALVIDRFARVLNFRDVCKNAVAYLDKKERNILEAYVNGVNHYINTSSFFSLPFEFWLFGVNPSMINWNVESSCLVGKLIEYYLTFDFFQEMMRTHLHEHLNISKDVIEKVFPFKFEDFEYQRTIIKDEEMKDLKYNVIIKTMADMQTTIIEKSEKKTKIDVADENILSYSDKAEATIDFDSDSNENFEKSGENVENQEITEKSGENVENVEITENFEKKQKNLENVEITEKNQQNEKNDNTHYSNEYDLRDTLRKEKGMGSNNFVISGKLSHNGHPYVVNDPHLQTSMPAFWYFANIKIGNEFHLTGATNAGVPLVFIGSNSHMAWAITNGLVDTADIFRIEKSKVNSNLEVLFPEGEIKKLNKRTETFYLNTSKSKSIQHTFLDTEYGPIINGHADSLSAALGVLHRGNEVLNEEKYFYILRSTFSDKNDLNLKGMINLPFSKNIDEMRVGLSFLSISLNIVYCDNKDNIGYQLTGKIPKKNSKESGAYIKTISSWDELKIETIPFEDLPHVINPEKGYIVTSNNIHVDQNYKHLLQGGYIMDARARALEDELESWIKSGNKVDKDFIIKNMLGNVYDSYCKDILGFVQKILKNEKNENFEIFENYFDLKNLLNFDCYMKGESRQALIYNVFENELHHLLHYTDTKDEIIKQKATVNLIEAEERSNYLVHKLKKYSNLNSKICFEEYNLSCGDFIIKAYKEAIKTIKLRLGENEENWKWENLNVKHYPHKPLSMIPGLNILAHRMVKSDGNQRTPKISIPRYYEKDFKGKVSSNLKFLINLHNRKDELYFSVDSGQSGRVFHRHYDDMQVNHEKGKLIKFNPEFVKEKISLEFRKIKNKA
jgi:acyl-homoserine lactone acylase PvdQ